MKKALIALSLLAATGAVSMEDAHAALSLWGTDAQGELTGSRTSATNGGIQATDGWGNGNFSLSWNITGDQDTGLWTYRYSANVTRKEISHFLLEVTNDGKTVTTYPGTDTQITAPQEWDKTSNGNSNPLMPNSLYGVKFNFGGDNPTYTIVTDRAPVYGVFYAKDGVDKSDATKIDVVAWSKALNYGDYKTDTALTAADFIVRPDSIAAPVPIPAAAWLLGSGLLGLVGIKRRTGGKS